MRNRLSAVLAFLAVAACGDATPPDVRVIALEASDTVRLDAIRDSVLLAAELVFDDGRREPLNGAHWTGSGADAATLHSDGWVWTRGEGSFIATVSHDTLTASTYVEIRREGRIVITFDDGWRTARTVALPALQTAGLRGNVAVVPETVGWEAFLDMADIEALDEAGWAFVSHSVTHADLATLSASALEAELVESRSWIRDQDLRFGNVFIVPYHSWGDRERAAIQRHYAAARGATVDATWPEFIAEWRPVDSYGITSLDASAMARTATGRADIMTWVHQAIEGGFLLDLMFHDIPPDDVADFLELVNALEAVRERVFTWAELYPAAE